MPFARPSLPDLVTRIQADFVSRLNLAGAALRRSIVYVFARVVAGAAHMMHGHLEFLGRQLFPDRSEAEFLVRQAAVFGLTRTPPSFARASLEFTGLNATVIPAGTIVVRADGARYRTLSGTSIGGTTTYVSAEALEAGSAGSLAVGVTLTLESPISGVNATVTVDDVEADGTDEETTESLRERLLQRLANPAHGGTVADYVAWAREVPGVTRVWVTTWKDTTDLAPGSVLVRFVRDNDPTRIPDSGEVAAVQAKLDLNAPAHALPIAAAPIDAPIAFTLSITPDTPALRTAVAAQLDAVMLAASPGSTVLVSSLRTAIGSTPDLTDYTLTTPAANVTHTAAQLASVGAITWV